MVIIKMKTYTTNEVANIAKLHPRTIRKWCARGHFECKKVGRDWIIFDSGNVLVRKIDTLLEYKKGEMK